MIGKLYTSREKKAGNDWTADRMNSRCDFHVTTWKESVFHQPASCSAKRRSSSSYCWWRSFVSVAHDRRRCTNYVVPPSTCCPLPFWPSFCASWSLLLWFSVVKRKKSNTKQKNNTAAKHHNYDSLMTPCICFVLFVVCFNRFSHFAQKIKSWVLCLSRA